MPFWESIRSWLEWEVGDNALWRWAAAVLGFVVVFFALRLILRWGARRLAAMAGRTSNRLDDLLSAIAGRTSTVFLLAIALLAGAAFLSLARPGEILRKGVTLVAFYQVGVWANAFLLALIERWQARSGLIIVGDHMGTVENIGLKTTRLRSLSGEQLIFSNNDLLSSRIRNYKRMQERRVVFSLGVTYQTPREKLAALPGILREVVEAREATRFDRAHFARYGDSALELEVVYFVLSADYNVYMDIQQAINLDIFARFADEGVDFAYPTRTLYVEHVGEGSQDGPEEDGQEEERKEKGKRKEREKETLKAPTP